MLERGQNGIESLDRGINSVSRVNVVTRKKLRLFGFILCLKRKLVKKLAALDGFHFALWGPEVFPKSNLLLIHDLIVLIVVN